MPAATTSKYELTFILPEDSSAEQAQALTDTLAAYAVENGGSLERTELWGKRELAYVIGDNRSGFYATLWLMLPGPAVQPLERMLRLNETVIRSLVTKAYADGVEEGSLTFVPEEEKPKRPRRDDKQEGAPASAEEELRRSSGRKPRDEAPGSPDPLDDAERAAAVDAGIDELLKEDTGTAK